MVTRPYITFPAPPLKFRTAGFPQYGFKLEFNHNLQWQKYGLSARLAYAAEDRGGKGKKRHIITKASIETKVKQ